MTRSKDSDRALSPVDEEVIAYLKSLPPPPEIARGRETWPRTGSGSWDVDAILGIQQTYYADAIAKRIAEERAAAVRDAEFAELRAEKWLVEQQLESLLAERRKFWSVVLAGIIIGVVVGVLGWVSFVLIAASRGAHG
jgi:hypothetical protein